MAAHSRRRERAALIAVLVILLVLVVGALRSLRDLSRLAGLVQVTTEVQLHTSNLMKLVVDAEAGQRGFLASGERRFLDPYEAARGRWPAEWNALVALTRDNPAQRQRLFALRDVVVRKMKEMEDTVVAYRQGSRGPDLASLMLNGKELMDDIRGRITDIQANEEALQAEQQEARAARGRLTVMAFLLASFVSAGLIVLLWVERQRLEGEALLSRERERNVEKLEKALELRDEFLSIASHELRTPLTASTLQVQSVRRLLRKVGAEGDPRLSHKMETADRQVHRLETLVNELLDVTRISAGGLALQRDKVDLAALAREMVERQDGTAQAIESEVSVVADADVVGDWDRARLDQVVTNLLSNAARYGAGKPVEVAVSRRDDHALLTVSDHGIGIRDEDLSRIFD